MTELRRNRVDQAISESGKAVITQLIPKLEPSIVRETVQSGHEFWPKDKRYDFQFFMRKVSTISLESAKYSRKGRNDDHANRLPSPFSNHKKKKVASFRRESTSTGKKSDDPEPFKNGKKLKKTFTWTEPGLNDECDGIHPVKDCKDTSDEKKKSLLKKNREDKEKKRKAALASLKHTDVNDGRWSLLLQDKYECVALGDNGADYSAIPRSIVDELTNSGLSFPTVPLNPPLHLDAAIKLPQSSPIIASSKVQLSVTLSLPCGPLRLRRAEFVVVDHEMNEVLLGRPLLQCLGFDLETHLEQVRTKFDNADVSDLMAKVTKSSNAGTLSTLSTYGGLWYNRIEDDPIPSPESVGASIGPDDETEVQDALNLSVEEAKKNGMSNAGIKDLKAMIVEFRDIFRVNLGSDPPAKVEPMDIRLKDNHRPVRATQRRYAPPQAAFITSTIKSFEKVNAVFRNPQSRWASPGLAVAKPGPDKFRFTVDLRAPNSVTIPVASAMPDMEFLLQSTAGSKFFAKLDMCHAYWQIPLHPDSQEALSIQTPIGVFTPTRALQGSTDAGNHFQSSTSKVFSEIQSCLLPWQDGFLMHEKSEVSLLAQIRRFFELCLKFELKLHAKKVSFFQREAKFCGRILDADGVRYDPRGLDTLMHMRVPEMASDLQQFLCATNWMRNSIPCYAEVVAPLHRLIEDCYAKVKKRTKRAVKNLSLHGLWGTTTHLLSR